MKTAKKAAVLTAAHRSIRYHIFAGLILVAVLILYADARETPEYLHAGLILALLSFVSTLATARYAAGRGVFPR